MGRPSDTTLFQKNGPSVTDRPFRFFVFLRKSLVIPKNVVSLQPQIVRLTVVESKISTKLIGYLARAVRDRSAKPGTAVRVRQVPQKKPAEKQAFFV